MKNIVETASSSGSFNTLVTAVKAAGLAETLSGKGPFTVFAPTDEAFAKLPKGTVESLLGDRKRLTDILTYHVVPGMVGSESVRKLKEARTVNGKKLNIHHLWGTRVDKARIVKADIQTSNGVIHAIDRVLIPS